MICVVLSSNQLITSEDLPSEVLSCRRDINKTYKKVHKSFKITITDVALLNQILDGVEKLLIKKALDKYGSTRSAATALKISQTSIIRKIHKNNIQNK